MDYKAGMGGRTLTGWMQRYLRGWRPGGASAGGRGGTPHLAIADAAAA